MFQIAEFDQATVMANDTKVKPGLLLSQKKITPFKVAIKLTVWYKWLLKVSQLFTPQIGRTKI